MAKRKKSLSQHFVSTATPGLPGPLKSIVTSRIGAPLTLMVVGGLIATGVLQFNWQGGRPRLTVDEQRAAQLEQNVSKYVDTVQENIQEARRDGQGAAGWLPRSGDDPAQSDTQAQSWSPPQNGYAPPAQGYGNQPATSPNGNSYPYGYAPQQAPNTAGRWNQQR